MKQVPLFSFVLLPGRHESRYHLGSMQPAEPPSLLDDAGFLEELERGEYLKRAPKATLITGSRPAASGFDETARHRAHVALERSLEPEYHHQQHDHSKTPAGQRSRGQIPRRLVLLVLILGLVVGAGVASVMFYDRVALFVVERIHIK
jgi:hypothetical protein